tara:strand:+ start:122 stop:343 length:222 start_codon:yes stop_codon:yes gene_type:complete
MRKTHLKVEFALNRGNRLNMATLKNEAVFSTHKIIRPLGFQTLKLLNVLFTFIKVSKSIQKTIKILSMVYANA